MSFFERFAKQLLPEQGFRKEIKKLTFMKKLELEKMQEIEGGCTCEGAGICCERWNLSSFGLGDWAVCYGCDGRISYIEAW